MDVIVNVREFVFGKLSSGVVSLLTVINILQPLLVVFVYQIIRIHIVIMTATV